MSSGRQQRSACVCICTRTLFFTHIPVPTSSSPLYRSKFQAFLHISSVFQRSRSHCVHSHIYLRSISSDLSCTFAFFTILYVWCVKCFSYTLSWSSPFDSFLIQNIYLPLESHTRLPHAICPHSTVQHPIQTIIHCVDGIPRTLAYIWISQLQRSVEEKYLLEEFIRPNPWFASRYRLEKWIQFHPITTWILIVAILIHCKVMTLVCRL